MARAGADRASYAIRRPWLDPPAEHGALRLLAFLGQKVARSVTWLRLPPRAELAEADGLRAFLHVVNDYRRTEALGLEEQPDVAGVHVADCAVYVSIGRRLEAGALSGADGQPRDRRGGNAARRTGQVGPGPQWTATRAQIVIRGTPATALPVVERIKAHGSTQALELAAWLSAHLHGAQLVERERSLVVPGEDLETLSDRCASLEASLHRIGLPMERIGVTD